ncbi:MAG: ATP-binding protein [Bermanella sp.]
MALDNEPRKIPTVKGLKKPLWASLSASKGNSLSKRMLVYILLCSTCFALIITLLQLAWDYQKDVSQIEKSIQQIEVSYLPPIAVSLWNINNDQIQTQIEGILKLPNMQYVQVKEIIGKRESHLIARGEISEHYDLQREFPLVYEGETIGKLFIAISLNQVYRRLLEKAAIILVSQTIKTFMVSLAILFIIYQLVVRHIRTIVEYTRNLDLNSLDSPLQLQRGNQKLDDELTEMVNAFNKMREKILLQFKEKFSASKQLVKEQAFSQTIINSSSAVVICLDQHLSIISTNPAGVKLCNTQQDILKGKNWLEVFCEKGMRQEMKICLANQPLPENKEIELPHSSNSSSILLWNFVPFLGGSSSCRFIAFGYDITPLKNVEREIKQLNLQLEEKVTQRTKNLQLSNSKLEDAFKQLKNTQKSLLEAEKMAAMGTLVSGVAHEINTPIGTSITAISFMQEKVKNIRTCLTENTLTKSVLEDGVTNLEESLDLLLHNQHRAAKLIDNFKQVAVNKPALRFSHFNLHEHIQIIKQSLNDEITDCHCLLNIDCDKNIILNSYPISFVQIFSNLILNSIIHGFEGWQGPKIINIQASVKDNIMLIEYSDTGRGVEKEIAENIFDPFVTTKRNTGGSGLGTLVIFNLVVQLLKGKVEFNTKVGKGVHFTFHIPFKILEDQSIQIPANK